MQKKKVLRSSSHDLPSNKFSKWDNSFDLFLNTKISQCGYVDKKWFIFKLCTSEIMAMRSANFNHLSLHQQQIDHQIHSQQILTNHWIFIFSTQKQHEKCSLSALSVKANVTLLTSSTAKFPPAVSCFVWPPCGTLVLALTEKGWPSVWINRQREAIPDEKCFGRMPEENMPSVKKSLPSLLCVDF